MQEFLFLSRVYLCNIILQANIYKNNVNYKWKVTSLFRIYIFRVTIVNLDEMNEIHVFCRNEIIHNVKI